MDKIQSLLGKFHILKCEILDKGYSSDIKYILKSDNKTYLLRISSIDKYESKFQQFMLLKKLDTLNIYCSKPIEFGKLDEEYCYILLSYLEGIDGKVALASLNNNESYNLGLQAGKILKKMHSIQIELPNNTWFERYVPKALKRVENLMNCGYQLPNQEKIIKYYNEHLFLMKDRPLTFTHGDYHLGNLIVKDGKIGVIDFDRNQIADPYDDLKPYCWNVIESDYFQTGLINGYFNYQIPSDFFLILKFYTAEALLSQLPWSVKFGQKEIDTAIEVAEKYLIWWDDFKLDIPTWYKGII